MVEKAGTEALRKRRMVHIEQASPKAERKPLPLGADARRNSRVVLALALFGLGTWTASSFSAGPDMGHHSRSCPVAAVP